MSEQFVDVTEDRDKMRDEGKLLFSLELAVQSARGLSINAEAIIDRAKAFHAYLKGDEGV